LDFDRDGNLIVADALEGLLSINPGGGVTVLCTEAGYHPFRLTEDVDVDSQNVAWFSDASYKWNDHMNDVLESAPNGRLLKYDINTGECSVVLGDLFFANGIAVSPDETYVLVNDMTRYRVKRVYVRGPRKGDVEVLTNNLPGLPDGISTGADGIFWLAFITPRNALMDFAGPRPWLRKLIHRIPVALQPKPMRHPFILGLNGSGRVVHNLQDADGLEFSHTTSVEQVGDWLYIGSLVEPKWGRISISSLP
jgi:sugar lactone lactonase YvrE